MKCRAKRVHAPRSRPLFTRLVHAARSPSTQRRSRPPFTRFCKTFTPFVHAFIDPFTRTVHAFGAPFTHSVHRSRVALTRSRGPPHRFAELVAVRYPSPRRSARRRRRRRGHGPEELGVWWTSPLGDGPFARVPYRSACRLTRWLICISARAKGPAPSGTSTTRLAPQARAHAFFSSGARSVVGSGPPPPCLGRAGRRASRVRVTPPAAAPSRPLHLRGRCTFAHARHLRACSSCRRSLGALSRSERLVPLPGCDARHARALDAAVLLHRGRPVTLYCLSF